VVLTGSKHTVPVGAMVYAVVVEPNKYTDLSYPASFPWLSARSPDHHVLTPAHLCKQTGTSSLSESITAFRATHAGKVTLIAPLGPRWAGLKNGPPPYRATVTVRR
jgi:hypothetical protein